MLVHALLLACIMLPACEDRLPTNWTPPQETVSDNAFILEGNGYQHRVFNFSMGSARMNYFPDDNYTSIWNFDSLFDTEGKKIYVTMQITFPGKDPGVYAWQDAFHDVPARSIVRLNVPPVEWVSTATGSTEVEISGEGKDRRLHGQFEGVLQNSAGQRIIVSHGAFNGPIF
jgi:hypothetical protein